MAITGKTILITGASSGLGRQMALDLSRGNNNLVVTARREALLRELATEIEANGSRCTVVAADAINPEACQGVLDLPQRIVFCGVPAREGLDLRNEAVAPSADRTEKALLFAVIAKGSAYQLDQLSKRSLADSGVLPE